MKHIRKFNESVFDDENILDASEYDVAEKYNETLPTGNAGYMYDVTYDQIVAAFGEPIVHDENDKVRVEWPLKFHNGIEANVYDYGQQETPLDELDKWSIGRPFEITEDQYIRKTLDTFKYHFPKGKVLTPEEQIQHFFEIMRRAQEGGLD